MGRGIFISSSDFGDEIAHYDVIISFVYVGFSVKVVVKSVKVYLTREGGWCVYLYDFPFLSL